MNKIKCSNCYSIINKSGLKVHQSSKKCQTFALDLPSFNAIDGFRVFDVVYEITSEITSENWNEMLNEPGTCYVCMIDDIELVETCGRLIHQVCKVCRIQLKKCPMCRTPISQSQQSQQQEQQEMAQADADFWAQAERATAEVASGIPDVSQWNF